MLAGCAIASVLGVVLSYGAFLMAFLGLFFYLLLGLIMGALTYRVASLGKPYPRRAVVVGTAIVVLVGWGTSLAWEIRDFPHTIARNVIRTVARLPEGMNKEAYRAEVVSRTRSYLARRYPPGGAIGYVRWMATNGKLEEGLFAGIKGEVSLSQGGSKWLIRVVLSLLFLTCGVASLTMPLAARRESKEPPTPVKPDVTLR